MSKEEQNKIVPKWRFPEFKNHTSWKSSKFSDSIVLYRGSSPRPIQNYLTTERDGVNWIKIGDTKFAENFIISKVEEKISKVGAQSSRWVNIGELILANSMSFGKTYQLAIDGCIYDGWFVLREYENFFEKQFLLQLLNSEFIQRQYKKLSAGGIVQNISSDIVYQTILPLTSKAEQQKIADCLSSLDELITAHIGQLEALKAHKKGLLQQLFPTEGEKVPRRRFPQFQDSGEWEELPIGMKVNSISGNPFSSTDMSEDSNGLPLLRGINITEGFIRHSVDIDRYFHGSREGLEKFVLQEGDLVIGMDGSKVGKNSARITARDAGALLVQRIARLRSDDNYLMEYIFQKIKSSHFHDYVDRINTSGGIPHISLKQIEGYKIPFPPSDIELQKIASCLSSLDDHITAQTEKIAQLKLHKKGLMQGLFPNANELKS